MPAAFLRVLPALVALFIISCGQDDPESGGLRGSDTSQSAELRASDRDDTASSERPVDAAGDTPTSSDRPDTTAVTPVTQATGKRYNVKSGIVELRSSAMGDMRQTTYFDDYGARQAVHATMESGGTTSRSVMIMDGRQSVVYDPSSKVGTRIDMTDALSQIGLGGIPNLAALDAETRRTLKYQPIAGRTVLGKKAEGASIELAGTPVKVWSWEGVPLRLEASMNGQTMTIEATSLKTDVAIPSERFVVPSDVKVKDLTNPK